MELIDEATTAGASLEPACEILSLSVRTVQRWRLGSHDLRCGPKHGPANKLSETERKKIIDVSNSPEYRDVSPKQIVPRLADKGVYIGSESSFYRTLHAENLLNHRERARPATRHKPSEHAASGPWQVASWDITYLKTDVAGRFYYLYLVLDVWSRKILGWEVHDCESKELAAELIDRIAAGTDADLAGWVLHADNGGPMKGSTMLATLQRLGVVPSFSRPSVSDDNPFSESLFRTMKYAPAYPAAGFISLEQARLWVARFVAWYNGEHLHSGIRYVTPNDRHDGRDVLILAHRHALYQRARRRHPTRWSRHTRCWDRIETVYLNPDKKAVDKQQTVPLREP